MSNNADAVKTITGEVRLSYVNVFNPIAKNLGEEAKYSVTLLIPKSDVATKQRIDAAMSAAVQQGISEKFNGVRPPLLAYPIHDGDGVKPSDGMPFSDECKGHYVMTASSKQRPEVVDMGINPIINQTEVYSGMYGRVSIRFFPYNNNGKKGVGCGLGNIQKTRDGEPLSGRASASEDFGAPAGYGQPAQPQYQQPQVQYQQPQVQYQQPQVQYQQSTQSAYPQQPAQIDPITGRPIVNGVIGI